MVKGIVRRVGGKYYNYKYFIDMFPEEKVYCELFVGGGSVVINKKQQYKKVVINDNDTKLINCYKHIQSYGDTINIDGTYTKEAFIKLFDSDKPEDYLIQHRISFITLIMYNQSHNTIKNSTKLYTILKEKLKDIIIHNEDWYKVLLEYDSKDTFFYIDPPYENSTKTAIHSYSDIDLTNLFHSLKTIKGKFLMTINDSEYIRKLSSDFIVIPYQAYYFRSKKTVTELIVMNYLSFTTSRQNKECSE